MLTDNDSGAISKKNCTNMHMAQMKCSLSYHSSYFYFDDMKGGFYKDRNIGDGICGIKMLKQNMRERNWKD